MKKIIYKSNNVIRCMLTIPEEFNGSESKLRYDVLKAVEDSTYGSSYIEQVVIDEDLLFLINQSVVICFQNSIFDISTTSKNM